MKYYCYCISLSLLFVACSPSARFRQDKAAFNASKITHSFKSVADMNDSYFELRENGFFEFYRQLFDSVKNTVYPGKYTVTGDTLRLSFYDKKGTALLGSKAVIKAGKKEIVFFK